MGLRVEGLGVGVEGLELTLPDDAAARVIRDVDDLQKLTNRVKSGHLNVRTGFWMGPPHGNVHSSARITILVGPALGALFP